MRPFGPDPWTRERSTPSSRANRRTEGEACACLKASPSIFSGARAGLGAAAAAGGAGASRGGAACSAGAGASAFAGGAAAGGAAADAPFPPAGAAEGARAPFPSPADAASSTRITLPWLTLSPTLILSSLTVPAAGEGTSIVALSDSSAISGSSGFTASPGFTNTWMIGTSLKSPMSGTLISSVFLASPDSDGPRGGPIRLDPVFLDGLGDLGGRQRPFVGQRLERRDRHLEPVDLEEAAQLLARVGTAVPVGPEGDVPPRHVGADLLGEGAYVVGRGDDRSLGPLQELRDVRLLRRLGRVEQVPPAGRVPFARQLGEARAPPEIRLDPEIGPEQLGRGDDLAEDGSRAEELHARRLLAARASPAEQIHPAHDALGRALGHGRVRVVLVEHRHVIVDVLLLLVHAAQSVLHDHRDLVAERRVVRHAVGHGGGEDVRVAVLVLQALAVERGPPGGGADEEPARAHVACRPAEVADALEAEHRIEDEEGDHRRAVRRVRGRRGDPVAHRAGLGDALL